MVIVAFVRSCVEHFIVSFNKCWVLAVPCSSSLLPALNCVKILFTFYLLIVACMSGVFAVEAAFEPFIVCSRHLVFKKTPCFHCFLSVTPINPSHLLKRFVWFNMAVLLLCQGVLFCFLLCFLQV